MNRLPTIAIVGVTGAVGQEFLRLIQERDLAFGELRLIASARSAGKTIEFMGETRVISELNNDSFNGWRRQST